jgi:hypothetical protein
MVNLILGALQELNVTLLNPSLVRHLCVNSAEADKTGYSVITYLLQIKDRHNGNILVDRDGHLIHIDFGFMLSNSPGGNMGFEAAPFKLPLDYVEIIGGLDSPAWAYFKKLFKEGFEAARKHSDSLISEFVCCFLAGLADCV